MNTKKIYLNLFLLGACIVPSISFAEANTFKSSLSTEVEGIDKVVLPAFGDDEWDEENHGTNTQGFLTIDRIPSFVWNSEIKRTSDDSVFDTGSIINKNAYLQITDTRGSYKGYVVKVLFDGDDKWFYDDNIEVDPAGIELKLETKEDDFLNCTKETEGILPPTVSTSIMTMGQEFDAVIAEEGTGVGTWGVWWKKSHILMDKYIPRADHSIRSKAITWRLVDAPR